MGTQTAMTTKTPTSWTTSCHPSITTPPELQVAIGKGSFGVVWKARDEHGRDVAVKIVPLVHSAGAEEELDQEVELMRRFCHPNLVQFHTAFRIAEARQVWVVMELCEAGSHPIPNPNPNPNPHEPDPRP